MGNINYVFILSFNNNFHQQQECIPVGCVPSAAVTVSWGGVSAQKGGVCPGERVSAQVGGEISAQGGGGGGQAPSPPPVDRETPVKTLPLQT